MSNMINSQPRFGLEEEGGTLRIFDYATSRYISATDNPQFDSVDGVWDTQELINLIKTQQPVYGALADRGEMTRDDAVEAQRQVAEDQRHDKVEQFKADFMAEDEKPETDEQRQQREAREQAERDEAVRLASEEEARRQQALAAQGEQPQS